ncbi:MAG: DNA gyrase subunit A [candidate division Zixibacteria bacterium RBG_16_43_9]|nr:MAG: DNA gyrase subunit A [candidate division Zixibacteria bacterium RBG_16_43_9]
MALELEREKVVPVLLEEEMKSSYIDYSMSVITARALPDVRDGMKPSNRRILVAMNDLNLAPGRPHRKCAKIAGDTSGNYHPHGEQVVYPTLVRMAQDFNMRYPLVDGQGNFGSIDGDAPAAMRYTEARLTALAMEVLADLDKDTVDFVPNYDGTRDEPVVLPSKFPNLICNGSSGIAVGMATNIPTHNLSEVVDSLIALIDDPELEDQKLLKYIQGPDFPTGGIIYGRGGIKEYFKTGRGRLVLRARASIEKQKSGKESIIVTEIPYQINKSNLLEKIAELVNNKVIEGISDLRDESDREGMRIVIELKRESQAEIILNQLFNHTQMQTTFGVITIALVDGVPKVLNLKELLSLFIEHRHTVITRRTKYELAEAEKRAHILEGLKIALDNIDAVIKLIRASKDPAEAKEGLMNKFKMSEIQAQAILDMRLQRLTGLERKKVEEEYLELIKLIATFKGILESKTKRMNIIKEELLTLKKNYGDQRRTEIKEEEEEFTIEDLIAEENMLITISHNGYIKRLGIDAYRRQGRGGKGVIGMETREEDFVEHLFIASTHDYILFFTNTGKCHWLKVHEIPVGGRVTKGKSITNLLELAEGERIRAFAPVKEFDEKHYVVMATKNGTIKKTELSAFSNPRRGGINAINIDEGDELIDATITDGTCDIVLGTKEGLAIRFPEDKVRSMGRTAYGVRGVSLRDKDVVVGMVVIKRDATLLVVTENGFGKRTPISDYRVTNRGGKGVINVKTNERNGKVVALKEVLEDDELMLITEKGMIIRQPVKSIKEIGRNTQGVKLISLDEGDRVVAVARVVKSEEEEGSSATGGQ